MVRVGTASESKRFHLSVQCKLLLWTVCLFLVAEDQSSDSEEKSEENSGAIYHENSENAAEFKWDEEEKGVASLIRRLSSISQPRGGNKKENEDVTTPESVEVVDVAGTNDDDEPQIAAALASVETKLARVVQLLSDKTVLETVRKRIRDNKAKTEGLRNC